MMNLSMLMYNPMWEQIECICHEAYHGYQHELISQNANNELTDSELINKAICYEKEFNDYQSCKDDLDKYYYQQCEIDARDYNEKRVEEYQRILNNGNHIDGGNPFHRLYEFCKFKHNDPEGFFNINYTENFISK